MKNNKIKPPRLAEFLLKFFAPDNYRNVSPGDFEEVYNQIFLNKGRMRARVWYWFQILRSVVPFLKESFYRSINMFRNYFIVALRNLKRNKVYSLLNVMGLAIGITAFLFIALDIQYELSYDRYHDNADNIYRVAMERPGQVYQGSNKYAGTPGALAQAMVDDFPEVESGARVFIWSRGEQILQQGEKAIKENLHYADPQIFDVFTIPFLKGEPETALRDPWSLVISEQLAAKYFGDEDPIGEVYSFQGRYTLTITGVFKTMPQNSHFTMDMITPMETFFQLGGWGRDWNSSYCKTYILLGENEDPEELETKFPAFMDNHMYRDSDVEDSMKERLYLQPLTSIHLSSHINSEFKANYDMKNIYLFSSVGLLIIIIACMNYMNLATTRAIKRSKEVGMRKVAGAKRGQLIKQFLGESVVLTMIALILSMILVYIILPRFSSYLGKDLNLNP
ncbi:ABC transporter permease, partial [candidate division KSB1 bacterium]